MRDTRNTPSDRQIAQTSSPQGGHITRKQLRAIGLSNHAIAHRVECGRLIRVYQGVYAVGRLPSNPLDRCHGALLAAGGDAAMAGWSAATIWGVRRPWRYPLEVIVADRANPSGLIVHRSTKLERSDFRVWLGVRLVSPPLTALQIAPTLSTRELERAIDGLCLAHAVELDDFRAIVERFPRHPGARFIRRALRIEKRRPTRSRKEQDWRSFATRFNLPPYEQNVMVAGYEVDVLFTPNRLVVELDGPLHDHPWAEIEDPERDAEILTKTGIPVLRITTHDFTTQPAAQAAKIEAALDQRSSNKAIP
jgi:very-short-patch-repair endonuclease